MGSFGKTTTTAAVAAALGQPRSRHPRENGWSNVALAVLGIGARQRYAVIEIGIDGRGQMAQYATMMRPDVVVVTSIGSEHHRSLGSLDETRDEKAQILRGLRSDGLAVLNGDDPRVRAMAAFTTGRVLTFGFEAGNDVRATEVSLDWPHGTRLQLQIGGETRTLRVRLLGRVMMYPVLAAATVAWAEARSWQAAAAALESVPPQPGRMQPVRLANGAWLIRDDFKSALETIDAALDVLAEVPGRRIVVLGDISEPTGSQGPHYRRVGSRLATIAARVVIVGGSFQQYASGAARAGLPRSALIDAGRSARQAAASVLGDLGPADVVLVKGRDTQRLDRVALALQGRTIRCDIDFCNIGSTRCETCPMLEEIR